jgi:hypothetical protein
MRHLVKYKRVSHLLDGLRWYPNHVSPRRLDGYNTSPTSCQHLEASNKNS